MHDLNSVCFSIATWPLLASKPLFHTSCFSIELHSFIRVFVSRGGECLSCSLHSLHCPSRPEEAQQHTESIITSFLVKATMAEAFTETGKLQCTLDFTFTACKAIYIPGPHIDQAYMTKKRAAITNVCNIGSYASEQLRAQGRLCTGNVIGSLPSLLSAVEKVKNTFTEDNWVTQLLGFMSHDFTLIPPRNAGRSQVRMSCLQLGPLTVQSRVKAFAVEVCKALSEGWEVLFCM